MEFYYIDRYYQEAELEEIEGLEKDNGTIRRQFVIKGLESSPTFIEPEKLFDHKGYLKGHIAIEDVIKNLMKYAELLKVESIEELQKCNKEYVDPIIEMIKNEEDEAIFKAIDALGCIKK